MVMICEEKYVEMLRENKTVIPAYTRNVLSFIKKASKEIDKFDLAEAELEETPEEIISLVELFKKHGDYLVAYAKSINKFSPVFSGLTKDQIVEDLKFIKSESIKDSFILDSGYMSINFKKEIITKDVYKDLSFNFGIFTFQMLKDRVQTQLTERNTKRNKSYHPYILTDGKVCLGTYEQPYKTAMASMNFHTAYLLLMQCMTIYGGSALNGTSAGPQDPIELWIGQVCTVCESQVNTDDISLCNKTNRVICPKCVDTAGCIDETTSDIYHPDVLKTCLTCGKLSGSVIRKVCLPCRELALH